MDKKVIETVYVDESFDDMNVTDVLKGIETRFFDKKVVLVTSLLSVLVSPTFSWSWDSMAKRVSSWWKIIMMVTIIARSNMR